MRKQQRSNQRKLRNERSDAEARVIGFLVAKGLLIDPRANPLPLVKLTPEEVLWVAENVEPRVLEVLPAALLHFPRSFLHWDRYPKEIQSAAAAIRKGDVRHPNVFGLKFADMKRWAELELTDRRTKPVSQKRVMRAFRLRPETITKLSRAAAKHGITETELLERAVLSVVS
jgi:hypothetical protein